MYISARCSTLVVLGLALLWSYQQLYTLHKVTQLPPPVVNSGRLDSPNSLKSRSAITTEQQPPPRIIQRRDDNNSTFSACLLVADDNHFLIEWLAYHYTTLPLRYLVIARDPRSRTSPKPILDRWEPYMTIERWNDKRFLPKEWLNRFPAENDPIAKLMKHRERQRHFYPACFEYLKSAGRQWVMVVDVDEFVMQNIHYQPLDPQHSPSKVVMTTTTVKPPQPPYPTLLQAIQHQAPYNWTNTTCITMPRLRFGNYEDGNSTGVKLASPLSMFRDQDFLTYRYRWRAGLHSKKENRHPKSTIRVDRISNFSRLETDAHRPVRSACPKRNMYILNRDSPFTVHHYVGSKEQFRFRKDARDGTKTRSDEQLDAYSIIRTEYDISACSWLQTFADQVGHDVAKELLAGVGNVSYIPPRLL